MNIKTGNFDIESKNHKDWIIGHFLENNSPFKTDKVEIKWSKRKAGYIHPPKKDVKDQRPTLGILLYGEAEYILEKNSKKIILKKEGDYLFYKPNVPHKVIFKKDSLVLTIRWPSNS